MSKIKGISIVTAVGVKAYEVGVWGVTAIISDTKCISTDCSIEIYIVMKGDTKIAEISASCPLQIEYKE